MSPPPSPGLYFSDYPPAFHLYPACISPYLCYPPVSLIPVFICYI